jgi:hypothetical protein
MPDEIIGLIYSHMGSLRTVSNFRESCKRFAKIGIEHLFRVVYFFLEPRSCGKLIAIAYNHKPEHKWFGGINVATLVRVVVMEEAVLRPFEDFQNMGLDGSYQTGRERYTAYRESQIDYIWGITGGQGLSELLWDALLRLPNLEGLHGHLQAGLAHQREPDPGAEGDISQILRLQKGDIQPLYERRLFDACWTNQIFVVPDPGETYSSKFHSLAAQYVQDPSPQNPRGTRFSTLCIRTKRQEGAMRPAAGISHYPRNSTKRVVLHYDGNNMYGKDSFARDCKVLRNRFIHMSHLSLHGRSIGGEGLLNLNPLGNRPNLGWDNLDLLALSNVLITKAFALWVKGKAIRVKIHNAVWSEAAIDAFKDGSKLRSVEVSGLQAIDFTVTTCTIDIDEDSEYEPDEDSDVDEDSEVELDEDSDDENPHDIYVIGTERTAPLIAANYWPHISSNPLPDQPWNNMHIEPEKMEQYLLEGGDRPLTKDRCWGTSDLRIWEY